jgi:molybdate transport system regulatory protein
MVRSDQASCGGKSRRKNQPWFSIDSIKNHPQVAHFIVEIYYSSRDAIQGFLQLNKITQECKTMTEERRHQSPLRLRLVFSGLVAIGPGKIDLLEAIAATGSISAVGRSMNMSL